MNTSHDTAVTVQVETQDAIECCELRTTRLAAEREEPPGTTYAPGRWALVVPPGSVFGFVTEHPVKITNPSPGSLVTVYADGKDPWPQPPPAFEVRKAPGFDGLYKGFLMTSALPSADPRPIVMTLTPAHASP